MVTSPPRYSQIYTALRQGAMEGAVNDGSSVTTSVLTST
jgi:TRAP-type C4-dicarboxylate transport system substrate-binding protein